MLVSIKLKTRLQREILKWRAILTLHPLDALELLLKYALQFVVTAIVRQVAHKETVFVGRMMHFFHVIFSPRPARTWLRVLLFRMILFVAKVALEAAWIR